MHGENLKIIVAEMFGPQRTEVGGSVGYYFIILFDRGSEFIRHYGCDVCIRYVTTCNSEFW
jgi:hypothetical protein